MKYEQYVHYSISARKRPEYSKTEINQITKFKDKYYSANWRAQDYSTVMSLVCHDNAKENITPNSTRSFNGIAQTFAITHKKSKPCH